MSDTLVRVRKRRAKRMPRLSVDLGHTGWMMARMLTLTKQKQRQWSHKLSACLGKTAFLKKLLFQRS
jgi:hypothetical protein